MKKICNNSVKKLAAYIIALAILSISGGCFQEYYKIAQPDRHKFREVVSEEIGQRYFVVYHRGTIRQLQHPLIQGETLQGTLSDLSSEKANFVFVNRPMYFGDTIPAESLKNSHRYRPDEKFIIEAVHVYLKQEAQLDLNVASLFLPLSAIQEVHVYTKDHVGTFVSHFMPFVVVGGVAYSVSKIELVHLDFSGLREF